jgi:pantothenate kinase
VFTETATTPGIVSDVETLVQRAQQLAASGRRVLLGIAGAPGSGKSSITAELVDRLGAAVVAVPMDGFHLADSVLDSLGLLDRKGAPETFDVGGFVALLERIRTVGSDTVGEQGVYAPLFDRDLEASLGSAIPVPADAPLVIVEGNYLLLDTPGWSRVRDLLDEVWFIAPPEHLRLARLIDRHVSHGRSRDDATAWARGTDQRNADLVERTRASAHLEFREIS